MKKLYIGLLVLPLALSLAACRKTKVTTPEENPDTPSEPSNPSDVYTDDNYTYESDIEKIKTSYNTSYTSDYNTITFYTWDFKEKENEAGKYEIDAQRYEALQINVNASINTLPLPTAPRDGYTFAGWYVDLNLSTPFYYTTMPKGDLVAYPKWEISNTTIYVSPSGSPLNDGSRTSKAMSIEAAARLYKAGTTINIAEGTYKLSSTLVFSSNGDANTVTKVVGGTDSNGKINVTLNFSSMLEQDANQGIKLCGNFHEFSDIIVKGAGDNGMLVGSSNNVIKNCVFTENHDTGLQISRFSGSVQTNLNQYPANNLILNCTSYNNSDTAGEDADGFAAKLTVGQGNVFDGCLAYCNVDDGWDLYAKQDSGAIGLVTIRNCVSMANGRRLTSAGKIDLNFDGDGNGFKLGGSSMPGEVIVENCLAAYNYAHGFTDNSNPGVISIKNCTSIDNGLFNLTLNSKKEYDNFNLNRSSIFANKNYYQGLFSYYDADGIKGNSAYNSDEFNGSLVDSILYYKKSPYKVTGSLSIQMGEGFVGSKNVTSTTLESSICNNIDPESLFDKGNTAYNLHDYLRNSDGSLNLKGYFTVDTATLGITCGANLNKSSYDSYNHSERLEAATNETKDQTTIRNLYNALNLAVNNDYIYNDIYLPTTYYGVNITWTSSNTSALSISNNVTTVTNGTSYTHAIIPDRIDVDTKVTLTATFSVGSETKSKTFEVTIQGLEPRIGVITGIEDINQLHDSTNIIDLTGNIKVYDYTSSNVVLNSGSDYTLTTKIEYQSDYGEAKQTLSTFDQTKAGIYTITYTFKIDGYDDVIKTETITIVNSTDTYKVVSTDTGLGYIIDNTVTLSGVSNYPAGTLYAVATSSSITSLTPEEIIAGEKEGIISSVITKELSSINFSLAIALNNNYVDETQANVFLFIKNSNGNGLVTSATNIEPTILIDNYNELKTYLNTSFGMSKALKLTKDIDASGDTWYENADNASGLIFKGYFDGAYHTIKNLNIEVSGVKDGGGLFYKADNQAIIKNLRLEEVFVTQTDANLGSGGKTAVLVGEIKGGATIENIYLYNCGANAYQRTAGIVGQVTGSTNSASTTTIRNIIIKSNQNGNLKYSIRSCYESKDGNNNTVYTGGKYVGGILAHVQYDYDNTDLYIENCYVETPIYAYNQYSGGIVGRVDPQKNDCDLVINKCVFAGILETSSSYAGGIISGRSSGTVTITNCVNIGNIKGEKSGMIVSTQLCNATTIGTTKTYAVNTDYVTMENCYWVLADFDPDNDSESTVEEYIANKTLNKEYYGQYIFASNLSTEAQWAEVIGIDTTIFSINNSVFSLKCFE